jgi:predicted Rdx family selenoprotein
VTGTKAELLRSSGGVFDVFRDGERIFSKKALGRFPNDEQEVIDQL